MTTLLNRAVDFLILSLAVTLLATPFLLVFTAPLLAL